MTNSVEFEEMAIGTVVETHNGNQWRKRPDGLWDILTDPGWGPATSADIPCYAKVVAST